MRLVLVAALLSLFCHVPSYAQKGTAVLIDSNAFYDPQNGIPELAAIAPRLEREFSPIVAEIESLQRQIVKLENDLRLAKDANEMTKGTKLSDEIENQSRMLRIKSEDARVRADKRRRELSEPVEAKVSIAIKTYATEKKYDVVLDQTATPLYESESWFASYDRTLDFIKWYRARPLG